MQTSQITFCIPASPSPRRAWIEIFLSYLSIFVLSSPSPRRAWIEILIIVVVIQLLKSPSPRRAWIEMVSKSYSYKEVSVALPTEGVD